MVKEETIAAISTPLGEGGIGIVRMSGDRALEIADLLFQGKVLPTNAASHTVHHGKILHPETGEELDEVLVIVMRSPNTYTREDMVEISCHGGIASLRRVLEATLRGGARLAERGEFTKRAFLNGRIDLTQAEAVLDIVKAKTERGLSVALGQLQGGLTGKIHGIRDKLVGLAAVLEGCLEVPEEVDYPKGEIQSLASEIEGELTELVSRARVGRMLREGLSIPIVGRVNVGKSSLLNALLDEERAIVTRFPGTTRDTLSEWITLDGFLVRLIDTAGLRRRPGVVERMGVERTKAAIRDADLVLLVLDRSEELRREDIEIAQACRSKKGILVLNKADLPRGIGPSPLDRETSHLPRVEISATHGLNMGELKEALAKEISSMGGPGGETALVINLRHVEALRKAIDGVRKVSEGTAVGRSPELLALDVGEALDALGTITGETAPEEILDQVFSKFCVGK